MFRVLPALVFGSGLLVASFPARAQGVPAKGSNPLAAESARHAQRPPGEDSPTPRPDAPVKHSIAHPGAEHEMWMQPLGRGWHVMGMAQVFPVVTLGAAFEENSPLRRTQLHLTQPVAMLNLEDRGSLFVLRVTPNLEAITLSEGELNFGGWGEGFIDARHPHTVLHEAMLSLNLWEVAGGSMSISAGKGFVPFGTDDPMARPVLKYPTNHHLSQILERWTLNGVALFGGWGVEAAIFGGAEPEHPYDLSNIRAFGDSFSLRLSRRLGEGFGPLAPWEISASHARVRGARRAEEGVTVLYNTAVRHAGTHGFGTLYVLVEGSLSQPEVDDRYFSILGETQVGLGRHQPYYRIEYATRPEFAREGPPGTDGFFRYDHDAPAIGATRWLIHSIGYGYELTGYPVSARLFAEAQHHHVREERGEIRPVELFGTGKFWSVSAGVRMYFGGGPMRMGTYGVLDPMTATHRQMGIPHHAGASWQPSAGAAR